MAKIFLIGPEDINTLPATPGAYGLVIELKRPLRLDIATLGPARLAAGSYLYVGSANGPGGLKARISRHVRRKKKIHWHVDRLTAKGLVSDIIAAPGGNECVLGARALRIPGVTVPVAGFGASDCTHCESHLLLLPGDGTVLIERL